MVIEEAIKRVEEVKKEYATMDGLKDYVIAIETLLTAYEKEKEEHKKECHNCDEYTAKLGELETENKMLKSELEKEKEKNKPDCAESIERTEEMVNMRWVNYHYISKDKIKAKVEEYEEKIKKIKEKNVWEEPYDTEKYVRYTNYISVLQSLLKEE